MDREKPEWNIFTSKEHKDFFRSEIKIGDHLLKPEKFGQSPVFVSCKVTAITEGKIYLDNSKVPIQFPGRCVNISAFRDGRIP